MDIDIPLAIIGVLGALLFTAYFKGMGTSEQKSFNYYSGHPRRCRWLAKKVGKAIENCGIDSQSIEKLSEIFRFEYDNLMFSRRYWEGDESRRRLDRYRYALCSLSRISQGNFDISCWEADALNLLGVRNAGGLCRFWAGVASCPIDLSWDAMVPYRYNPWLTFKHERMHSGFWQDAQPNL